MKDCIGNQLLLINIWRIINRNIKFFSVDSPPNSNWRIIEKKAEFKYSCPQYFGINGSY